MMRELFGLTTHVHNGRIADRSQRQVCSKFIVSIHIGFNYVRKIAHPPSERLNVDPVVSVPEHSCRSKP